MSAPPPPSLLYPARVGPLRERLRARICKGRKMNEIQPHTGELLVWYGLPQGRGHCVRGQLWESEKCGASRGLLEVQVGMAGLMLSMAG